jgi:formylglycine-generating enzyme required for sulfatase activity
MNRGICWVLLFFVSVLSLHATELNQPVMALYSSTNAAQREVAWATRPGIRYVLQENSSLASNDWKTVAGFPSEAEALAQYHLINVDASNRFYRVQVLDEQPPEIIDSYPLDGDFGVGRFSPIRIELEDGVDTNSLSLTYGSNVYTLGSTELSFSTNNVLELDLGGDTALGYYGTTQTVSVAVSDLLGNSTNITWQFELEEQIVASSNLFVFGSPDAQRSGQQLSGVSATVAARFNGPMRMAASADPWVIDSVTSNTIVLAYASGNAPVFEVGQKLANLAPAHESEIFYREVVSISDDSVSSLLTLSTIDVLLTDIMEEGSFSLGDEEGLLLEFDESGSLVAAKDIDKSINLPTIGMDFSDQTLWSESGVSVKLKEAGLTLEPKLKVSLKTKKLSVERFETKLSGDMKIACIPSIEVDGAYEKLSVVELGSKSFWKWFTAGVVPVGVEVEFSLRTEAEIKMQTHAELSAGFRRTGEMWVSGKYSKKDGVEMDRGFDLAPLEKVEPTYLMNGSAIASVSLIPQIDAQVYGLAGIYVNTDPRFEVAASVSTSNEVVTGATFRMGGYADINVGLSMEGVANDDLPSLGFNYFTKEWVVSYTNVPPVDPPLVIAVQPVSRKVKYGDDVSFSVEPEGGNGIYTYQWFQNEKPIPGQASAELNLDDVDYGFSGEYFTQISSGSSATNSDVVNLNVVPNAETGPTSGMVRIPGGTNAGVDPDFGAYSLTVETFYMDRTEITKALWDKVYNWAIVNGYSFSNSGSGKASNHPVHTVNWYDCVKWCNARSEMAGRTPCYTVSGSIYKTGQSSPDCNFNANGYRLPTNTEWEYAARGGLSGRRFPWGDTISHSWANYTGNSIFGCDESDGLHPLYDNGGEPYTSPVGSFAANGYGLYDMSGNVWEWCWDADGAARHVRGGSWIYGAYIARCGNALRFSPDSAYSNYGSGFRTVCR